MNQPPKSKNDRWRLTLVMVIRAAAFLFILVHYCKDFTQDILQVPTFLDAFGDIKEDISCLVTWQQWLYHWAWVNAFLVEFFLIVATIYQLIKRKFSWHNNIIIGGFIYLVMMISMARILESTRICELTPAAVTNPIATPTPTIAAAARSIILTATADGQTALALLQTVQQLQTKRYDFGVFIEAIDGLASNDQFYWAFYVNGQYATQGADQTMLNKGDQVEFRYEQIQK